MERQVVFEQYGFRAWRMVDGPHLRHDFEVLERDDQEPRSRLPDDREQEQLLALLEAAPPSQNITQAIHALRFEMGLSPQARW
jgi:hypothetical protein